MLGEVKPLNSIDGLEASFFELLLALQNNPLALFPVFLLGSFLLVNLIEVFFGTLLLIF